jgi:predicted transglutaminase-like cysteine proteinase
MEHRNVLVTRFWFLLIAACLTVVSAGVYAEEGFVPDHHELASASANTRKLKAKWLPLLDRSKQELALLEQGAMRDFFTHVRSLDSLGQIRYVHRWVNSRMDYRRDVEGDDNWQSAGESIRRGAGDCEDYSIAKYALLRYLGYDAKDLMLVGGVGRTLEKHIVLYVRHGELVLALDQDRKLVTASDHTSGFLPVFGFREQVSRLYVYSRRHPYVAPKGGNMLAERGEFQ